VTVCILNQARHTQLIKEVRQTGARIKLIEEGEISGCLSAIIGEKTDIYMGYGYAPESTLVAAAINCLGGYFEGKILYENNRDREQAKSHGINDFDKIFRTHDLIRSKEVAVAATGVTEDLAALVILQAAPARLRNNDVYFPYRQDSDFYYLTGFAEPDSVLVLQPGGGG